MGGAAPKPAARPALRSWLGVALLAALSLSCSELPSKPLRLVNVTGVILDRDGAPIEYVRAVFRNSERIPVSSKVPLDPRFFAAPITDASGAYTAQVYEGMYRVTFLPPTGSGYPNQITLSARISPGDARVDYRYTGMRIHGFVYGPGGTRLPGAAAYAYGYGPAGEYLGGTSAIDRGSGFSMLVPQGRFDFSVAGPNGQGIPSLEFTGYTIRADTTLEFHLDGFPVSGTVTGPDGNAMPGAQVHATSLHADCSMVAGADGGYLLHLPAGRYTWSLFPPGNYAYVASRQFPSTDVAGPSRYDFPMGGARWSGTVRLLPDSLPARDYAVEAITEVNGNFSYATTQTDSAGAFLLVVPPGLYDLRIWNSDASGSHWDLTNVPAASDSTLDIVLDPAAATRILASPAVPVRPRAGNLPLDPDRAPRPAPAPALPAQR